MSAGGPVLLGGLRRARRWIARFRRPPEAVGLRGVEPFSRAFGLDRGTPVDRRYVSAFLEIHRGDVRGDVLEAGDSGYTRHFGTRLGRVDVLDVDPGNPRATVVADLSTGTGISADAYDCVLLTQVYPFIFELPPAVRHSRLALRPGGVLLATLPGITQISRYDADRWGDYWRFTPQGARKLFGAEFGDDNVRVEAYGNVRSATAFLYGLAAEELSEDELAFRDPDYPVLIGVRALRAT